MKPSDYEAVLGHLDTVENKVIDLVVDLAAELGIEYDQTAALCIRVLADRYFPNHTTDRSLAVRIDVEEEHVLSVHEDQVYTSSGLKDVLTLIVPGVVKPFDDAVDAIIYSESLLGDA